jgi:hypothetical protein
VRHHPLTDLEQSAILDEIVGHDEIRWYSLDKESSEGDDYTQLVIGLDDIQGM